jgi:hypothetical protein
MDIAQNTVTYRELVDQIEVSLDDHTPLGIIGDPGIGKTTIPRQVAERMDIGLIQILGYLFEPVDFRGLQVPEEVNRTTVSYSMGKWPFKRLIEAGVYPERGILLLDEMLNAHRDVLTAFAEPLCDHAVNGEPLADGWSIVFTGNRLGSGTSANPMPIHVSNRVSIVQVKPDWNEWLVWAATRIRPELLGYFSMQDGADLFAFDPSKIKPNTPYLTPRSLEKLSRKIDSWYKVHGSKPPIQTYSSVVGDYGGKLYATLDYLNELVAWDTILKDPAKCPMPSNPAAVYSQIQIIGGKLMNLGRIGKRESAAAYTYIQRFSTETTAVAMQTWNRLTAKPSGKSEWSQCPEWSTWFAANAKLFTA